MTGLHHGARFRQVGDCPDCGKKRYPTRKAAKNARHDFHPGDRMNAYRCGDYWHLGHGRGQRRRTS